MFLVGTFTFVSTFTGEAIADDKGYVRPAVSTFTKQPVSTIEFKNSCTLKREDQTNQPEFQQPPFAYADTIYNSTNNEEIEQYRTITFDAVQDKFYLQGDGSPSANTGYDGYLYNHKGVGKGVLVSPLLHRVG
ncbi:hypothetical protein D5R40_13370, partial [Okeania hirsuta]